MASSPYLLFLHHARVQLQLLSRQLRNGSHSIVYQNCFPGCKLSCRLYSKTKTVCSAGSGNKDSFHETGAKYDDSKRAKTRENQFRGDGQALVDPNPASEYFRQSWINHCTTVAGDNERQQSKPFSAQTLLSDKREVKQGMPKSVSTFGTLSAKVLEGKDVSEIPDMRNPNERIDEAIPEDTDARRDRRLNIPLTRDGRIGKRSYYYTRKISMLGREGKIREAIDIFEYWMMVRDRVMPSKRTFVALIGILGRVGYMDKAFELVGKMKQLGLDPEDHIYTSLFNACANCPFPTEGLKRAEYLLSQMEEKGIKPNLFTVKAGMKALAICGNFPRAFALLDEASTHLQLDEQCFDHLLMACISDTNAGFTRALQVWKKMVEYRVQPSVNTFNMLIRCARDCGIGKPSRFATALGLNSGNDLPDGITHELDILHDFREKPMTLDSCVSNSHTRNSKHLRSDKKRTDSVKTEVSKQERLSKSIDIVPLSVMDHDDSHPGFSVQEQARKQELPSSAHVGKCIDYKESQDFINQFSDFERDLNESLLPTSKARDSDSARVYEWWEDEPSVSSRSESQVTSLTSESGFDKTQSLPQNLQSAQTENRAAAVDAVKKISLKDLKSPEGRLALLGGASKLLSFMEEQGIHPEVRTYAQIVACLPQNEHSELELLRAMEKIGVKPDIDLLNDIMMRRNMRHQSDTVKAILPVISKLRLVPNMRTYAALALTCHKEKQAHELLEDMKEANLEPNATIMGHLIYISRLNFTYKLHMLKTMESLGLRPNRENIAVIEKAVALTKRKIIEAEKNGDDNNFYLSEQYRRSFQHFLSFYRGWLVRTEMEKQRHPWEAFERKPEKDENESFITAN